MVLENLLNSSSISYKEIQAYIVESQKFDLASLQDGEAQNDQDIQALFANDTQQQQRTDDKIVNLKSTLDDGLAALPQLEDQVEEFQTDTSNYFSKLKKNMSELRAGVDE